MATKGMISKFIESRVVYLGMPDTANQLYIAEIRFNSRAVFHDIHGRIVESIESATGLPDWILQHGNQVIVHDGGPQGTLNKATRQVAISQSRLSYVVLNPASINSFLNEFKDILDKVYAVFNKNLTFVRLGARSVRFLPMEVSFAALTETFLKKYGKEDLKFVFENADLTDVGFAIDFVRDDISIHAAHGPMEKAQAIEQHFQGFSESKKLNKWANVGIFFDMDFYQTNAVPDKLPAARQLIKGFLEEQDQAAKRLKTQIEASLLVPA